MKPSLALRTTLLALIAASSASHAADWSDTSIGYRHGSAFSEPFNGADISKDIVNLTSASGYKYGKNFFNVDLLFSSSADPSSATSRDGAHEAYVVYRHTLDVGKIRGTPMAFGPVRGVGATLGFDFNSKTDAGYNSKKRLLVAGPTLMFDVPGFLDVSLLALWESNAPFSTYSNSGLPRYRYKTHPMIGAAWGIPFTVGGVALSFEGYANFIASKGKNEFGADSAAETNIDMQIMYDLGAGLGMAKNTFKVGVEYQYWKNKFGNSSVGNPGATARTPMVRAEYHF